MGDRVRMEFCQFNTSRRALATNFPNSELGDPPCSVQRAADALELTARAIQLRLVKKAPFDKMVPVRIEVVKAAVRE